MSLKDIFKDSKYGNASTSDLADDIVIESRETVAEILKSDKELIPLVDYSDPTKFAKFGSAEEYYISSVENIYKNYPYDGSKKEKQEFYNGLALYEKHIFDNEYPKSTGYVYLSGSRYILIKPSDKQSINDRENPEGNIYDSANGKLFSINLNKNDGNTVEFWFKLDSAAPANNTLFHITGSNNHKLFIAASDTLYCAYSSGSTGITTSTAIASSGTIGWSSIKNSWHHYAITFKSNPTTNKIDVTLIIDGNDTSRSSAAKYITASLGTAITSSFNNKDLYATIGASIDTTNNCAGKFDEFRFWRKAKNSKEIAQNWFTTINGGENTTSVNNGLDLYYKFNEGIISNQSTYSKDSIVLDYSGRFTNAVIKNYTYLAKSTDSAMDESGMFDFSESGDPVIFSENPLISTYLDGKKELARDHDFSNTSQFFNIFPNWIRNEDEIGNGELKKISQIISSYLDKLYLQIDFLNKIKYNDYETTNEKPIPFAKYLLESKSIVPPELFTDATILEEVYARNDDKPLEERLNNVKNLIYKNLYNNLTYIYKTKGTEKSYRNLFRSFGIDDEILKFVIYADKSEIDLSKKKQNYTSIKKSLIDFSYKDHHEATVYQTVNGNNPSAIITSSYDRFKFIPNTIECQVLFPNIDLKKSLLKWNMTSLSSSLFGIHSAETTGSDLTWATDDKFNFQVYAVRDSFASKHVRFALKTNGFGLSDTTLTSSYYLDVYDNSVWNFAVRVKPKVDEYSYLTTPSISTPYVLEFYGVTMNGDAVQNEFTVTQDLVESGAITGTLQNKRLYIGAHRTNFTGSTLEKSDVRILGARYWLNNLENETIQSHASNFDVYSPNNSSKKAFLGFITGSKDTEQLNEIDTLVLNWDFSKVTGSDTSGKFPVYDIKISTNDTNIISNTSNKYYYATGDNFPASTTNVIDVDYINIIKNELPEQLSISDTVKIKREDDILYTKDSRPTETFVTIESSMYAIISEEMMKMFSSVYDFSNLIGNPLNIYKKEYKEMNYLRSIFFEKVQEVPSFEKYLVLFKWIDSSINEIVKQLAPANASVPDQIATIIESHILERNKYERKLPLFQYAKKIGAFPIKSLNELLYNWKFGHAPLPGESLTVIEDVTGETKKVFEVWLKERAEKTNSLTTSGNSTIDSARQKIQNIIYNNNNQSSYNLRDQSGNFYAASNYIIRTAAKPYRLKIEVDGIPVENRKKKIRGIS